MLDPALRKLIRLQNRAAFRKFWKTMKTPSGFFLTAILSGFVLLGMLPNLVLAFSGSGGYESPLQSISPNVLSIFLYFVACFLILQDAGKMLLELRPAELQFVLAGPFSNSQILTYRLRMVSVGLLVMSVMFGCFLMPSFQTFVGGLSGIFLGGSFLLALSFWRSLIAPRWSKRAIGLLKNFLLLSVLLVVGEISWPFVSRQINITLIGFNEVVSSSWSATLLGLPFRPFAQLVRCSYGAEMVIHIFAGTALVVIAIAACYRVNDGFSELAVEGVARRKTKLDRLKSGSTYSPKNSRVQQQTRIPIPSWFGGVGPVGWSQIVIATRVLGRLVSVICVTSLIVTVGLSVVLQFSPSYLPEVARNRAVHIAMVLATYLQFVWLTAAQLGFAMNSRILNWYRVMAIRPMALAFGMALGTFFVSASVRLAFFVPAAVLSNGPVIDDAAFLFAFLVLDLLIASSINFVSAAFGLRVMGSGPPDILTGGRAGVFMLTVSLTLIPFLVVAAIGGFAAGAWLGMSWSVCSIAAGISLLCLLPWLWWVTGNRFQNRELEFE